MIYINLLQVQQSSIFGSLTFWQIVCLLLLVTSLIFILYRITNGKVDVIKMVLKKLGIEIASQEGNDPLVIDSSLKIIVSSLKGNYEYTCKQKQLLNSSDPCHEHGGNCQISIIENNTGILQWKLDGLRTWKKDGDAPKEDFPRDKYSPWATDKGIIFKSKEYMFTYNIDVHGNSTSFGFSKGSIYLDSSNGHVNRLSGTYYQVNGNNIIEGTVNFIKQ